MITANFHVARHTLARIVGLATRFGLAISLAVLSISAGAEPVAASTAPGKIDADTLTSLKLPLVLSRFPLTPQGHSHFSRVTFLSTR